MLKFGGLGFEGVGSDLHISLTQSNEEGRSAVISLVLHLQERVDISVITDGVTSDLRGEFEKIRWTKYTKLAESMRRVLVESLGWKTSVVKIRQSLLSEGKIALARVILDVPEKYKDVLHIPELQARLAKLLSLCGGYQPTAPEQIQRMPFDSVGPKDESKTLPEHGVSDTAGHTLADCDIKREAERLLAKVGGSTWPVKCKVEVEGTKAILGEVAGRAPDKAPPTTSAPVERWVDCYVDGFSRANHHVYLVEHASKQRPWKVAMPNTMQGRIAELALKPMQLVKVLISSTQTGSILDRELLEIADVDASHAVER